MKKKIFLLIYLFIISYPVFGYFIDNRVELNGYVKEEDEVVFDLESIGKGEYQTYLDQKWDNSFPGRKILLKCRNQILYSIFDVSPNSNVIIGKNENLFEPRYILNDIQADEPASLDYFNQLGEELNQINDILEKNDKELYVFITPSKADFEKKDIPTIYKFLNNEDKYDYTNYQLLIHTLNDNDIQYFDSVSYLKMAEEELKYDSPIFPTTGIHWSNVYGMDSASMLTDYISNNGKYDLGDVSILEEESIVPVNPDTDLYNSLNLLADPKGEWHSASVIVERESEKPSVFIRGGSFTFQSLNYLNDAGVFGEYIHISNEKCFNNCYSWSETMSDYYSYEELNIDEYIGKSDIVILEVNEAVIPDMSFGFIDYLVSHPNYLDCEY